MGRVAILQQCAVLTTSPLRKDAVVLRHYCKKQPTQRPDHAVEELGTNEWHVRSSLHAGVRPDYTFFNGVLIDIVEYVRRVDEDARSATYRHGNEYIQL